jgi:hypothetical protein
MDHVVCFSGRSTQQQGVCCRDEEQAAPRPREAKGHRICQAAPLSVEMRSGNQASPT